MGAAEITHRVGRAAQTAVQRALLPTGWGMRPSKVPSDAVIARVRPWFSKSPGVASAEPYRAAADQILAGRLSFFAETDLEVGFPPRWNLEPKSGIDIPLTFGKSINYRKTQRVGDVKYVWEVNRHPQLVTLAQAWHLTGERRYLDACQTLVDTWIAQCPYPLGINWTSSLEPAMRLVNWSAAWHLIGGDSSPCSKARRGSDSANAG